MPRHARLLVPGLPFHVVQRGVNKGAIFADDLDRDHFLRVMHKAFVKHDVALHAYVLMDNHVHLLATPKTTGGLAHAMRALGTATCRRSTSDTVDPARFGRVASIPA